MHLTKRVIDGLQPRAARFVVWDDDPHRFGVCVWPTGTLTFIVDYETETGRRRRMTIDRYGVLTVEQARSEAKKVLASVVKGEDPLAAAQEIKDAPTMAEFAARYMADHASPKKKPRSIAEDQRQIDAYILPAWRNLKVRDITRADVAKLHSKMSGTPVMANRVVALLSKMFALAEQRGERPDGTNPAHHVQRFRESRRTRFLSGEELTTLGAKLAYLESTYPAYVLAVRLLALTGCRLNEVLTLAWKDVDLDRAVLHLQDAKAGPRDVPLGLPAVALLRAAKRTNEWVVPSPRRKEAHLVNMEMWWVANIRAAVETEEVTIAALPELRIHDLRHTVGSVGAGAGLSILLIGNVLGHKQTSTAERYAHAARGPLHEAADLISGEIQARLDGAPLADVVELRKS